MGEALKIKKIPPPLSCLYKTIYGGENIPPAVFWVDTPSI